ncbi:MAG: hypothetical protein WBA45_04490 [Microthrixaceae bacterium]
MSEESKRIREKPSTWRVRLCVVGALLAAVLGVDLASPSSAGAAGRLSVSRTTGLEPTGAVVNVRGSGYDTNKGVYVALCVIPPTAAVAPGPCGGGIALEGSNGSSQWISSNPPSYAEGLTIPYGPGGSFDVNLTLSSAISPTIDCRSTPCAIATRNDHLRSGDRSQDVLVPVSFARPQTPPPTTAPPKPTTPVPTSPTRPAITAPVQSGSGPGQPNSGVQPGSSGAPAGSPDATGSAGGGAGGPSVNGPGSNGASDPSAPSTVDPDAPSAEVEAQMLEDEDNADASDRKRGDGGAHDESAERRSAGAGSGREQDGSSTGSGVAPWLIAGALSLSLLGGGGVYLSRRSGRVGSPE